MPGAIAIILALVLGVGACGDDDDDGAASGSGSGSGSGSAGAVTDGGGEDGEGDEDEPSEPLSEEDAREAGNPATFARIEALTDCKELEQERDNANENAEKRADDPERQSILRAYAAAAEERMAEVGC